MFESLLAPFNTPEKFSVETSKRLVDFLNQHSGSQNNRNMVLKMESLLSGGNISGNYHKQAMIYAIEDWLRITHQIVDYQYINDMNNYVKRVQTDEMNRLGDQYDIINNDVLKTKYSNGMQKSESDKYVSWIGFLMNTMLFVAVAAFLTANSSYFGTGGNIILVVLGICYVIYAMVYMKITSSRRKTDFNKFYFDDSKDFVQHFSDAEKQNAESCEDSGD